MKIKRFFSLLLVIIIILCNCQFTISVLAEENVNVESVEAENETVPTHMRLDDLIAGEDYIKDEIIVNSKVDTAEDVLEDLTNVYGLSNKYCLSSCVGGSISTSTSNSVTYVMSLGDRSSTVSEIISELENDKNIFFAQPNYIYQLSEVLDNYVAISDNIVKTYANSQRSMFYSLGFNNTTCKWKNNGGAGIKVAVVDSGIDLAHPALNGALWSENGVYGYNTSDPNNITEITMENSNSYTNSHGTHVAGIIAMQQNSEEYTLKGIAPGVEIIDIQVTDFDGLISTSSIIAGLEKSAEVDVDIINMSFSSNHYDYALNIACNKVARDMVIVAAAGNSSSNNTASYPAAFSSVIGVMAYGGSADPSLYKDVTNNESFLSKNYPSSDKQILAEFSNYDVRGRYYDIVAPGVNICSANAGGRGNANERFNGYIFKSGTSMATPIVSAVLALYINKYTYATPAQVRTALKISGNEEMYLFEHLESAYNTNKISEKLNINVLLQTSPDDTVKATYSHSEEEGYKDLCNLIKRHLGHEIAEPMLITNDDLGLISYLQINSYSEISGCIDKLNELPHLMGIKLNGYDFNDANVSSLINMGSENHDYLPWLETFEIVKSNVSKIVLKKSFANSLVKVNFCNNSNLKAVDFSQYSNPTTSKLNSVLLENNSICDVSFLACLNNLTHVYLSGNKIKDISPLSSMKKLGYLDLSNNLISDYSQILKLKKLYFVDLSFNYLSKQEEEISSFLDENEVHPVLIYKPFKNNYVPVEEVVLNDFSVKRTDVDFMPRITVIPGNATSLNNTSLSCAENDIITVDRYTGKINYNPDYVADPTAEEYATDINYQNESVSGSAKVKLLVPTIEELNFEKYIFNSGTPEYYITLLTTTDTTKVKVIQTKNGQTIGENINYENIEDYEYYTDIGDVRRITFPYNNIIEDGATITVYTGDSLTNEYESEVISNDNTITISVDSNGMISDISGSSKKLYIIEDSRITGVLRLEASENFADCDIDTVYFPSNVTQLGENAFEHCNVDTMVFYAETISASLGTPFIGCDGLQVYTLPRALNSVSYPATVSCCSDFNYANGVLSEYSGIATDITIPEVLEIIDVGNAAFRGNTKLKKITFSESIRNIYDNAFYNCSSLENVNNTDKIKYIGNNVFYSDAKLTALDLTSVEYIGNSAFRGCSSLENINILGNIDERTFEIKDSTFFNCSNLLSISYKGTLITGNDAFRNCKKLEKLMCGDVFLKGERSFYECNAIESIVLSEESDIKAYSFYNCTKLKEIGLVKKEIVQIGTQAFCNTTSLKNLGFLSKTISVNENTFTNCNSNLIVYCNPNTISTNKVNVCTDFEIEEVDGNVVLTKYNGSSENVEIPECLEIYEIGKKAFYSKDFIKTVHFPESLRIISTEAFSMNSGLKKVTGGKNVIRLGEDAFYYNIKLDDVSSLEALHYLGYACFAWTGLEKYEMPQTVYYCDQFVFLGCSYLKEIILSGNLYAVSSGMFYNCTNLERCIVKYGTKQYGQQIFDNCNNLKQIYIPDSAQLIQENSIPCSIIVYSSKNLKLNSNKIDLSNNIIYPNYKIINGVLKEYQSDTGYDYIDEAGKKVIDVPNAIETISERIFDNKRNVDKVILSDYLDVIEYGAFMDCTVSEIVMPRNMSSIGNSAFNRTKITQIDIPDGITKIDSYLLHNTPIQSVRIPNSVVEIGYRAFRACYMLKSIYIPDSVTAIDSCAFEGSTYPVTLYGNGNTYLKKYAEENSEQNGNNFLTCKLGYEITDGILKSYTGNEMNLQVPFGIGLTSLADGAFKNNTTIKSISIVSGITSIGSECFSGCTALTSIYVPNDVVSLGSNAFKGVTNLTVYCNKDSYIEEYCATNNISVNTDYDISNGVLKAYNGTSTDVVIPSDLCITEIGSMAFYNNKRITSVILPEKTNVIGSFSFDGCSALTTVTLPLTNIVILCSFAFGFCNNLTTINNSDMISEVGSYAFTHCSSLENINLCDVKAMSYNVFNECTSLRTITLGDSLSSIGTDAFKNCPNLVIKCYADTYAYRYAVENEIQYILLNDNSASAISLRSTTGMDAITNNTVFKGDEAIIRYNPDQELHEYICLECNGEVNMKNIDKVIAYIIDND